MGDSKLHTPEVGFCSLWGGESACLTPSRAAPVGIRFAGSRRRSLASKRSWTAPVDWTRYQAARGVRVEGADLKALSRELEILRWFDGN